MSLNVLQEKCKKVLEPLEKMYALAVRIHLNFLKKKADKIPLPVISVGNISMGGTGKTPVCAFLAEYFAKKGKKPIILSRGYKSKPGRLPHLVKTNDNPGVCGDEPLLLARSLAGKAEVVVDPKRLRAARWAMENLSPDVFILDDGFQHVQLKRDRDLVLLTPHDLEAGWNRVFPCGRWREDEQALERADIFLINLWGRGIEEIKYLVARRPSLRQRPVYYLDFQVEGLKNIDSGKYADNIHKKPYILVSGVANPQKIFTPIGNFLGYAPLSHLPFPDHHDFGRESVRAIIALAKEAGVHDAICTSKDAVKLKPVSGLRVWEMMVRVKILEGREERFLERL